MHFTFPAAPSGRRARDEARAKPYGAIAVFNSLGLHIERGDRIARVGPNGAGKSTLMRMLSGEESPDQGERVMGHQVVSEYFAQDEATRLDPTRTVYEALSSGSPVHMVPAIRNILGGFLFSGDDIYKKCGVLSGGERTRLAVRACCSAVEPAVARRADQYLDLDSKDVLLDALVDYGGTLIFVSHDRYRRAARHAHHRDWRRQGGVVPRDLSGIPVAQGAWESGRQVGGSSRSGRSRQVGRVKQVKQVGRSGGRAGQAGSPSQPKGDHGPQARTGRAAEERARSKGARGTGADPRRASRRSKPASRTSRRGCRRPASTRTGRPRNRRPPSTSRSCGKSGS
jgi:ABC-type lipoprotein export system ATPase subunit